MDSQPAVKGLERSNLILAGLTTDICLFHTARGAVDAGYEVQVVADACGSSSVSSDQLTFDRLRALGATITGGNQILSELFTDFGTEQGRKAQQINTEEIIARMPAA